jgi:hypothetical protein
MSKGTDAKNIQYSGWEIKRRERIEYRCLEEFENDVNAVVLIYILKEYTSCPNPLEPIHVQLKKGHMDEIVYM